MIFGSETLFSEFIIEKFHSSDDLIEIKKLKQLFLLFKGKFQLSEKLNTTHLTSKYMLNCE